MGSEIKRKLASIQRIVAVEDIPGADAIQVYTVLGWKVVDKKGAYKVGDLVVYVSIDSWVPYELASFLSRGSEPREYNGVKGERLRTIRLRGQISQGLLLPLTCIQIDTTWDPIEGCDVTEILGIQKWEAPIPTQLQGKMRGNFPSWARKTDQERCQNVWEEIQKQNEEGQKYEVTMKLDGSSMSVGLSPDQDYVVCSRNLSLMTDQEGNSFVDVARKLDLENKLRKLNRPLMISGELMGPSIQKNQEQLKELHFFVFDIFDPMKGEYLTSDERFVLTEELGLEHAPLFHNHVTLSDLNIHSLDDLLSFAEGPSMNAKDREGVVFKSVDGTFSFKAISNKWLMKNE